MLFNKPTLDGLAAGEVTATYRRWSVPRAKVGSRFTTRIGVLEVTSVDQVDDDAPTDEDARSAAFADRAALRRWTDQRGVGTLYRIGIRVAGPDPRVALRAVADLTDAEFAALEQKLDRMDRAAPEPWTRAVLGQIRDRPAIVSTELAADGRTAAGLLQAPGSPAEGAGTDREPRDRVPALTPRRRLPDPTGGGPRLNRAESVPGH